MSEKTEQKEMQSVEDVEAFLQEVEALLASDFDAFKCEPDVVAHMVRQARADSSRLIAIVREYQRNHAFATREWNHDALRANAAEAANKELRERLAKLEVASRAVAVAESAGCVASCHGDADDIADASKRLMVAASNLRRVMDGLPSTLPDETTALRERLAKLEAERQPRIRRKLARLQQSRAKIAHRLDKMDNRHNRANDERALTEIDSKIAALGGVAMDPLDDTLARLGAWIEKERLHELDLAVRAQDNGDLDRLAHEHYARADGLKFAGYKLNELAGRDLRIDANSTQDNLP